MPNLRILMTNMSLWFRSGTEMYIRDVAKSLARRGHSPVVYSTQLGEVAHEIQQAAIPVIRDLDQLGVVPDVIHGQHTLETMAAALRFPDVPVVFVCHDCTAWHDSPPQLPNVRRFVAVDAACRDRLLLRHGVTEPQLSVISNGIDLARFRPREPLPPSPRKALLFSSYIQPDTVKEVEAACQLRDIELDMLGAVFGSTCTEPEQHLPQYDIVFAKGRCAVEAMACGNAVILCDQVGAGPMMTLELLQQTQNCSPGRRWFSDPVERESLGKKIDAYDAADAAAVSRWIRQQRDLERSVDALIETYQQAISERPSVELEEYLLSASKNAGWWAEHWHSLLEQHSAAKSAIPLPEPTTEKPGKVKRFRRSIRKRIYQIRETLSESQRRAS